MRAKMRRFCHLRPPVLSVITSIRREAVTALQVVDALHLVGGQREVEDVVILGDVGRSYFRFCSVFIILMGFGSCSHIVID